jgi:FAD dependent oxidoreductase
MRVPCEIDALLIETKSGRSAVVGKLYIDCSGDGDLAAQAGAPFEKGTDGDSMLYPSTMFRVNGVDPERAWRCLEPLRALDGAGGARGAALPPQDADHPPAEESDGVARERHAARQPGRHTRRLHRCLAAQPRRSRRRRQIVDFFRFLRESAPGFENAYILEIAPQVGVRETRRVVGDYQLTEDDVLQCASFDDTIGVNGWPIEAHVTGDITFKWQDIPHARGFNHLPYRMLHPKQIDNLLVAGRCASMTHMGQSAARVSGACFAMGQAAGTAAALSLAAGMPPRQLDVATLQQRLERDGAFLRRTH